MTDPKVAIRRVFTMGRRKILALALIAGWVGGSHLAGVAPMLRWIVTFALLGAALVLFMLKHKRSIHRLVVARRRAVTSQSGTDRTEVETPPGFSFAPKPSKSAAQVQLRLYRRVAQTRERLDQVQRESDDFAAWRDILARVRAGGTSLPRLELWAFPRLRANPYQALLYQEFASAGIDVKYPATFDVLERAPDNAIIHLHWTKFVQAQARSAQLAQRRADAVIQRLEALRDRGMALVWSVHEALPHECPYPEIETAFRQRLAEISDAIHVLHDATHAFVAQHYSLDADRTFTVEHPLYTGVQPDHVSRQGARAELGVNEDEALILCFGGIRPYKAYERVIAALPVIQEQVVDRRVRLVIAGQALDDPLVVGYVNMLLDQTSHLPNVNIVPMEIPDQHVQTFYRAADVSVYPYRSGLNSGALFMSLTFGTPAVVHRNPVTETYTSVGSVRAVDCSDLDELAGAVSDVIISDNAPVPVDPDFASEHHPIRISQRMASEIRARFPSQF